MTISTASARSEATLPATTNENAPSLFSIGEAANQTQVSERTLRYYEQIGLLAPAGHSPGGSRRYGPEELVRVRRIRELQELMGLDLEEIRTVLARDDRVESLRAAWHASNDPVLRKSILDESMEITEGLHERISAKLSRLEAFRAELHGKIVHLRELQSELDGTPLPRRDKTKQPNG